MSLCLKITFFLSNYAYTSEDCMYHQVKCFTFHDYLMCMKNNYMCYVSIKIMFSLFSMEIKVSQKLRKNVYRNNRHPILRAICFVFILGKSVVLKA